MISVIATGGKQYLVKTGQVLKVEKLPIEEGKNVTFDQVLLTANDDGSGVVVGKPTVAGASVTAVVEKQGKSRTVRVERFQNKTRFHKVRGQRQRYSQIKIA